MILLKNLKTRKDKYDNYISYGLFLCPYCSKEVKKQLGNGKVAKSCGCMKNKLTSKSKIGRKNINFKHGDDNNNSIHHKLYTTWNLMKQRCYNLKCKDYKNYGGRGIKVCEEWRNNYLKFKTWALKNSWKEGLIIDRTDNDGNYEPTNCRFVTRADSNRNKRGVKLNWKKAEEIRKLYKESSVTKKELEIKYNITNISRIINNERWCKT